MRVARDAPREPAEPRSLNLGALSHLRGIVRAILAGRVEEARTWGSAFARLSREGRTITVGHLHWPVPWRWRPVRRYEPYGDRVASS